VTSHFSLYQFVLLRISAFFSCTTDKCTFFSVLVWLFCMTWFEEMGWCWSCYVMLEDVQLTQRHPNEPLLSSFLRWQEQQVAQIFSLLQCLHVGHSDYFVQTVPIRRWYDVSTPVHQAPKFNECTVNFEVLNMYFHHWLLEPKPARMEMSVFHLSIHDLNGVVVGYSDCYSKGPGFESQVVLFRRCSFAKNKPSTYMVGPSQGLSCHWFFFFFTHDADRQLQIMFYSTQIQHVDHSKYLIVTLDRTLIFKTYVKNTVKKIGTRVYFVWILIEYRSVAEYCVPIWLGRQIDWIPIATVIGQHRSAKIAT
jgi:hypothetical protein